MQLEPKTTVEAYPRPRSRIDRSQIVTGSGTADEPVVVSDDQSSPEDDHPDCASSIKDHGPSSLLELEAKKQKMESSDIRDIDQSTQPVPIMDDALLSAIPMPPSAPAVTVEPKCSSVGVGVNLSPVPTLPQEQLHSTPANEQISTAATDQIVTSTDSDTSYAFKRLTELPMPPTLPDDESESPSENNR